MQETDLLGLVQPDDGWFAVVGIKDKDVRQKLVRTREEVDDLVEAYVDAGRNVFFGVAKYKDGTNRLKDNVQSLKAFWLDIDCGPSKAEVNPKTKRPDGYIDQSTGKQALRDFCELVGMPTPTIVNSGRGLHVYWVLEEEITRAEWEPVAARLQQLCRTHDLFVDASVFEVARILRIPGTFNFKETPPLPVVLEQVGETTSLADLRDILGVKEQTNTSAPREMSERQKANQTGTTYNFAKIMRRSLKGEGCSQIAHAYLNSSELSYYEWFYALSVAAMCEDADEAVHLLSRNYPDYNREDVDKKVATIKMATSCAKFASTQPELCEGCKFKGTILGPKELGKNIKLANTGQGIFETSDPATGLARVYDIPEYPFPYARREGGGIVMLPPKDAAAEVGPILIYEHDLYVVNWMEDETLGVIIVFRLHLPLGLVKEFTIPLFKVMDMTELRKAVTMKGVVSHGKKLEQLLNYLALSVAHLQHKRTPDIMRQQFGWAENNTKFVVGDQEISAFGIAYSPPSSTTAKLSKFMGPVGSLDRWKEVWELYGRPGMEPHALAALSAFGAPLLKFLNQTGAAINLFNSKSGTGKTTVLNMINSVWGHPKDLRLKKDDTINGKLQWLGILNNLPCTMDEITNMKAEDFSDMMYALSNGKGKERMTTGTNELRVNNTTWQTISVLTSNSSFYEKLSILKGMPEGEMMRFIEYEVSLPAAIATDYAKEMFDDVLFKNYGHAGAIFIQYVLHNMEEVIGICQSIQAKIDRELRLAPRERFWSATVAANIAGGIIAKRAKLINWNLNNIYDFAVRRINNLRREIEAPLDSTDQVVGDYLYRHMQNILVINDLVDRRSNKNLEHAPIREPKGELLIRIEPDTKRMFITTKAFKEDCVRYQINYREVLRNLKATGRLLGNESKRLSKGMPVTGLPVKTLVFNLDVEGFIEVEDYAERETASVGGGG